LKKKTLVIISHRYSALRCCENIYRLDEGKLNRTEGYDQIISSLDT